MKYYQRISFIVFIGMNILLINLVMAQEPIIEKQYILEKNRGSLEPNLILVIESRFSMMVTQLRMYLRRYPAIQQIH